MRKILLACMALAGLLLFATGARADDQYKILVLAMPGKYHYEYIPIARESLEKQAKLHAFEMVYTHRPEVFDGDLGQYAMVMFLNTPGEELSEPRRRKFEAYMRNGGNAMLVHRALIIPPDTWPWFEKLVGRRVGNHPMLQTGVAEVVDKKFPATFGLPARWIWSDEWYVFDNPHNIKINPVLNVDESTYDPTKIWPGQVSKGMGRDHPVAWYHQVEKGRVFVTSLGHNGEMYKDPQYLSHLMGGIYWTATGRGIQQ
ncbi:ThuA domain-containing protein [Oxalobacteraceae bacterium OTU3REALA1]|nr:ThuA domain-containing protein [Oxalobacteraceae bacterium OTU3REALA1]